jgi:hypothetical protein
MNLVDKRLDKATAPRLLWVNRAECGPANVRCSPEATVATKVRRVVKGQKATLSKVASIAEIRRATAFVRARIAITSTSASNEAIAWEGGLVSRNAVASICKLVHVRTALAQRLNWHER